MSEAGKYDRETCEGCVRRNYSVGPVGNCSDCMRSPGNVDSDHDLPDHFIPSLQCHQVRALERIADSLEDLKNSPNIWAKETSVRPVEPLVAQCGNCHGSGEADSATTGGSQWCAICGGTGKVFG
jgi:hypothetical protein